MDCYTTETRLSDSTFMSRHRYTSCYHTLVYMAVFLDILWIFSLGCFCCTISYTEIYRENPIYLYHRVSSDHQSFYDTGARISRERSMVFWYEYIAYHSLMYCFCSLYRLHTLLTRTYTLCEDRIWQWRVLYGRK